MEIYENSLNSKEFRLFSEEVISLGCKRLEIFLKGILKRGQQLFL
jgi:hypothetical protein